jgi:hypothetical protein
MIRRIIFDVLAFFCSSGVFLLVNYTNQNSLYGLKVCFVIARSTVDIGITERNGKIIT